MRLWIEANKPGAFRFPWEAAQAIFDPDATGMLTGYPGLSVVRRSHAPVKPHPSAPVDGPLRVRMAAGRRTLDDGNVAQTMAAPVTALIGSDYAFYEHMDLLFPNTGARSWFEGKSEVIHNTAFRNASLQGGYLILAARALGLDCGPMSGFNNALADELFFAGTQVKSNFLVNIGYGNPAVLKPRNPRFTFDQACRIA